MIPVQIALVDEAGIGTHHMTEVAGALNEQLHADFNPQWGGFQASVLPYVIVEPDPGTWKVVMRNGIDEPGALGYHTDENHQPYALVDASGGDEWTVTASHEILEMLADPWGARLHGVNSWASWRDYAGVDAQTYSRVRVLVEVCDPCEAYTYEVGGVEVSDFVLPNYYRSTTRFGTPTDHLGIILDDMKLKPGGYISFMDPVTNEWYQLFENGPGNYEYVSLGRFGMGRLGGRPHTLREWTDECAREHRARIAE